MSIVSLLVLILVLAIVGWLIFTYIIPLLPVGIIRTVVIIIVVIIACLILLGAVGIGPGIGIKL